MHAGEAYGPASVSEAIRRCHAMRIGHGTRLKENPALLKGLNVTGGKVTYKGVAEAFGMEYHDAAQFVA